MTIGHLDIPSLKDKVSPEEWQARVDLAALYRLCAMFGWDDLIYTHISMRIPDTENEFLINPLGLMFEEITASSLLKINQDGEKIMDSPFFANAAGFTIHSAVHGAREDAHCVIHLHTSYGIAVSNQEQGLLPTCQSAIFPWSSLSYHDYEGIATRPEEKERLCEDLGTTSAMILRNHGTMTLGKNAVNAFQAMYFLEEACKIQILSQSGGAKLNLVPEDAIKNTMRDYVQVASDGAMDNLLWPALLRKCDRADPTYRD